MPSRAIAGTDAIAHELLEALGVDLNGTEVRRVTIEIVPDECVVITTERNVKDTEFAAAVDVVRRYKLHMADSQAVSETPVHFDGPFRDSTNLGTGQGYREYSKVCRPPDDKTVDTCASKFDNSNQFHGAPDPRTDAERAYDKERGR
jgi:hypothetical protein